MTLFGTVGIRYVVLQTRAKSFVLQRIRVYYVSLLTHNVIADVSFHIVGLHANERAVSVFGKNPMRFAVFWRISAQFYGFRTPLTPPSQDVTLSGVCEKRNTMKETWTVRSQALHNEQNLQNP